MKQNERIFLYRVSFLEENRMKLINYFHCLVRDNDTIKHYRIRQGEDGRFYIARRTTFQSLPELVSHYSKMSDGLCVNLRRPCVHVSKSSFFFIKYFSTIDFSRKMFSSDDQTRTGWFIT